MFMKKQTELKHLDQAKSTFEANGKKYRISKSLCIERWRHFEDLQAMVGFGRSFDDLFKSFKDIWSALDEKGGAKVASASIICHNAMTGIKTKLEERHHPALMMCTLFINYDGEDEKVYNEETMKSKIDDWQKEGYDINDFFTLAWSLVPSFIETYNEDIASTSSHTEKEQSSPSSDSK